MLTWDTLNDWMKYMADLTPFTKRDRQVFYIASMLLIEHGKLKQKHERLQKRIREQRQSPKEGKKP